MRKALVFIHLFLVIQLALPLSYYAWREDGNDERFAWRMFSPVRMTRCTPVFTLGEARAPVRLSALFHEAWLTLASRGRQGVIMAMARSLCDSNPGQAVRIALTCRTVDGRVERREDGRDVCEQGAP